MLFLNLKVKQDKFVMCFLRIQKHEYLHSILMLGLNTCMPTKLLKTCFCLLFIELVSKYFQNITSSILLLITRNQYNLYTIYKMQKQLHRLSLSDLMFIFKNVLFLHLRIKQEAIDSNQMFLHLFKQGKYHRTVIEISMNDFVTLINYIRPRNSNTFFGNILEI